LDLVNLEIPHCSISKQCIMAAVLKDCKLIVWDECTMSHKGELEAIIE